VLFIFFLGWPLLVQGGSQTTPGSGQGAAEKAGRPDTGQERQSPGQEQESRLAHSQLREPGEESEPSAAAAAAAANSPGSHSAQRHHCLISHKIISDLVRAP
jgi:hypothetical protein